MRDSEISSRLDKILIYKELKMRCEEDVSLAAVLALVHSIGEDAISLSKAIIQSIHCMMKIIFTICCIWQGK